ncbi:MAG: sensor histidine kinase [Thermoanaerobaculia bacterium]
MTAPPQQPRPPAPPPQPAPQQSQPPRAQSRAEVARDPFPEVSIEPDPFPKAPVVPFPVESTSLALTTMYEVLSAARVPSVLIAADRSVKWVSDEARQLLNLPGGEAVSVRTLELRIGATLPDPHQSHSSQVTIGGKSVNFSSVPLSGGSTGNVLIFRLENPQDAATGTMFSYVRETVLFPLRSLREALMAATSNRQHDPLIVDAASTIDQILSSLEMASGVEEDINRTSRQPAAARISDVFERIRVRFGTVADARRIKLQFDTHDAVDTFRDAKELESVLSTLLENSLHYVPPGGQVVVGLRSLDHKGHPLLLFFVMDNGPIVDEEMRDAIFEPGYAWNPSDPRRGGRGLSEARQFAIAHGGQIWVESKTGKACTFFLRVRPDA